ncbi:MAG: replicative DNA helicase [Kosmotoga sp.]|nr:replicative DNA helicase [Kosmotoga sp.]MBO8165726.1 replicative DNA helicase [Kosmotoga sp.]MCD6160586.1 replicative DNA helicase [Kosmotoga sp.]
MKAKVPPHSVEAEEAVIGSVLIDPDVLTDIMEILDSNDFYLRKHKLIFSAIEKLFDEGYPVDIVSITDRMRSLGTLDEIGSEVEIARLADTVPTSANAEYYARTVKEKSLLRSLIAAGSKIVEDAYGTDDTDQVLDKAERLIFKITESQTTRTYEDLGSVMHKVFENLENLKDRAGTIDTGGFVTGIPTGFRQLDKITTGFHTSDLIIVAARPSMGKTAFALNIARNMAIRSDTPIAFFCLEMTKEQLAQRLLCSQARVDLSKIRTGFLNDKDWERLTSAADVLYRSKIIVDDEASLDPRSLRAKARRIKAEHGIKVIFVDYLQLMHLKGRADNRQQEISEISRSLKLLARELDVTVIALSQLSRAVEQRENKRPRLSDLRESGAIEQDADMVMFLYREDYYKDKSEISDTPHEAEVIIGKQRNGPIGTIKLSFNPKIATFFDAVPSEFVE